MKPQYHGGKPAYRGAESFIYESDWLGKAVLVKARIPKHYRSRVLDERLRKRRTIAEARNIVESLKHGIPAPTVYYVDPENAVIVIEKVEGKLLRDLIEEEGASQRVISAVEKLGSYTAMLHSAGIVHGDLTTSNVMVSDGEPVIIDFGLSERSRDELDMAIDVHLFLRSLESTHPEHASILYEAFLKGYASVRGARTALRIRMLVERIRSMGRYVEEARRVKLVWGGGNEENSLRDRKPS